MARLPNMTDVAEHAGVSRMTVSNVINRPELVAAPTRERVLVSMRELRYRNNLVARSLRLTLPRQIGYILPRLDSLGDPYMHQFLLDLAHASSREGRTIVLIPEGTPDAETDAAEELYYGRSIAGVVASGITADDPRPSMLLHRDVPVAAYGQTAAGADVPWSWVDADGGAGMDLAVEHLAALGHRELALITTGDMQAPRTRGFLDACRSRGLTSSTAPGRIAHVAWGMSSGAVAARQLLDSAEPPTAIVCVSDSLAAGTLMTVRDLGLRPGRDVSVTGYDDSPLTSFGDIGITSIRQPSERIAEELVRVIIDPPALPRHILLAPTLVIRSSSGRV